MREARSVPDLNKAAIDKAAVRVGTEAGEDDLNATNDTKGLSGGLLSARKDLRQARSVAAIGTRASFARKGSLSRMPYVPKNTFGIIPTLAPINLKDQK